MNEKSEAAQPKGKVRELLEIVKVVGISLAIAFSIRYFIAQPFIVRGASMEPNFEDREYLVIDEVSFYLREPERGEVVVFRYPRDPRQFFIKRIIGMPGETVIIKNGQISIKGHGEDGEPLVLQESYLPSDLKTFPEKEYVLDKDFYLVLGDNRRNSSDSRIWGSLDKKFITGRAFFRAWPPSKFGLIPEPSY